MSPIYSRPPSPLVLKSTSRKAARRRLSSIDLGDPVGRAGIRHLPLPKNVVIAVGGMTYPLYLLHQKIGYDAFYRIGPVAHPAALCRH